MNNAWDTGKQSAKTDIKHARSFRDFLSVLNGRRSSYIYNCTSKCAPWGVLLSTYLVVCVNICYRPQIMLDQNIKMATTFSIYQKPQYSIHRCVRLLRVNKPFGVNKATFIYWRVRSISVKQSARYSWKTSLTGITLSQQIKQRSICVWYYYLTWVDTDAEYESLTTCMLIAILWY